MSCMTTERKTCLISTSYFAGLFDISTLLHLLKDKNYACIGGHLSVKTLRSLCDAYHKERPYISLTSTPGNFCFYFLASLSVRRWR